MHEGLGLGVGRGGMGCCGQILGFGGLVLGLSDGFWESCFLGLGCDRLRLWVDGLGLWAWGFGFRDWTGVGAFVRTDFGLAV